MPGLRSCSAKVMQWAKILEVAASMIGSSERGDDLFSFFGDQHHFGLHQITFGGHLIKAWGSRIYSLACLDCFSVDCGSHKFHICKCDPWHCMDLTPP